MLSCRDVFRLGYRQFVIRFTPVFNLFLNLLRLYEGRHFLNPNILKEIYGIKRDISYLQLCNF